MAGRPPGQWPSAFVTKFSPDGSSLVYSTYLGGNGSDYAYAIAVDSSGNAYVTGLDNFARFPDHQRSVPDSLRPDSQQYRGVLRGDRTATPLTTSVFVTKLNSTGTGLVYSTFLGGYGAGRTQPPLPWMAPAAPTLPATRADICSTQLYVPILLSNHQRRGNRRRHSTGGRSPQYAFAAAFDPTGAQLLYSTLFGDLNFDVHRAAAARMPPGSRWMPTATSIWSARPRPASCRRPPASFSPTALLWTLRESMCKAGAASSRSSIRSLPPAGASLAYATYLGGQTRNTRRLHQRHRHR